MDQLFVWIKALHVIAVISWMAGLLYLPRLFVYHIEDGQKEPLHSQFSLMESRLLRFIMRPALILVWLTGLIMVASGLVDFLSFWFGVKFISVLFMSGFHGWLIKTHHAMDALQFNYSGRQMRFLNEVPALLMILIVVMVIVQPF